MASSSFRDSINSLGWSRRDQDVPVNTAQQSGLMSSIKSLNPFGNNSYIQLPTTEGAGAPLPAASRREEEEGFATRESPSPYLLLAQLGPSSNSPAASVHHSPVLVSWFAM